MTSSATIVTTMSNLSDSQIEQWVIPITSYVSGTDTLTYGLNGLTDPTDYSDNDSLYLNEVGTASTGGVNDNQGAADFVEDVMKQTTAWTSPNLNHTDWTRIADLFNTIEGLVRGTIAFDNVADLIATTRLGVEWLSTNNDQVQFRFWAIYESGSGGGGGTPLATNSDYNIRTNTIDSVHYDYGSSVDQVAYWSVSNAPYYTDAAKTNVLSLNAVTHNSIEWNQTGLDTAITAFLNGGNIFAGILRKGKQKKRGNWV